LAKVKGIYFNKVFLLQVISKVSAQNYCRQNTVHLEEQHFHESKLLLATFGESNFPLTKGIQLFRHQESSFTKSNSAMMPWHLYKAYKSRRKAERIYDFSL